MSREALDMIERALASLDVRRAKLVTALEALMALDVDELVPPPAQRPGPRATIARGPKGRPRTPHTDASPRKYRARIDLAALETQVAAFVLGQGDPVMARDVHRGLPDLMGYRINTALASLVKRGRLAKVNAGRRGTLICAPGHVEAAKARLSATYVRNQRAAGIVPSKVEKPKPATTAKEPANYSETITRHPPSPAPSKAVTKTAGVLVDAIRAKLKSGASYSARDIQRAARQTIDGLEIGTVETALEALAKEQIIMRIVSLVGGEDALSGAGEREVMNYLTSQGPSTLKASEELFS